MKWLYDISTYFGKYYWSMFQRRIINSCDETKKAMNLETEVYPGLIPIIMNYKVKSPLFSNYMFDAIDVVQKGKNVLLSSK